LALLADNESMELSADLIEQLQVLRRTLFSATLQWMVVEDVRSLICMELILHFIVDNVTVTVIEVPSQFQWNKCVIQKLNQKVKLSKV